MRCRFCRILLTLYLAILPASWLCAAEIYHWVDANGVSHYSQWKPAEVQEQVQEITLQDTRPSDYDPSDNPYHSSRHAAAMAELWADIEQRRAAAKARQRTAAPAPLAVYPQPESYPLAPYWPAFGRSGVPRQNLPSLPDRPGQSGRAPKPAEPEPAPPVSLRRP